MKIDITKVLGVTKLTYLNYRTEEFNLWCVNMAEIYVIPIRVLQESNKLYTWYCQNWDARIEGVFLVEVQDFIEQGVVAPEHYLSIFKDIVISPYGLKRIYPSTILKQLKQAYYEKNAIKRANNKL